MQRTNGKREHDLQKEMWKGWFPGEQEGKRRLWEAGEARMSLCDALSLVSILREFEKKKKSLKVSPYAKFAY